MLMQMSPQMLQQLEELLAGGMTLPQAAKSLLANAGSTGQGNLFDSLLEGGLPTLEEGLKTEGVSLGRTSDELLAKLAGKLNAATGNRIGGSEGALAAPATGPLPVAGQQSLNNTLPPQLAANLLDMGVPQQVGAKGWGGAIADRLMWMVQGEQQFAKLRLNPPNLGPLEVRVSVSQDQTSVAFLSQHAAVREALEAALPRLREMFDQQSLDLVRADVSDPGAQQGNGTDQADPGFASEGDPRGIDPEAKDSDHEAGLNMASREGRGLVDLFA